MEIATKLIVITCVACFLISLGGVMKPIMEAVFPPILAQQLMLTEGSFVYDFWAEPPIDVYMQFYTMSIGNPSEFLQGEPPYVIQKGPYTYQEYRPKTDIIHNDNFTVTYYNNKSYVFAPELSSGPETEKFTTVNVAVFTIAYWLRDAPDGIQDLWELFHALSSAEPLMETSIKELMWGYEDPYLVLAQRILGEDIIPSTTFGLFLNANNSDDGLWTVFTGEDDINKLNIIDKWNGDSYLSWWGTDQANMINGTDGSLRHPYIKKDETLYMFLSLACRSGYSVFTKESRVAGTPTYRFEAPPSMLASPDENPANIGFCVPDNTSCPPSGIFSGASCYFNAPVYLSMPHFLYGDESLFEMVHGLNPNEEEHVIYLDKEPLSGLTFAAHLRAMMSLKVQAYDYIDGAQFISDAYLPIVWLNETFTISQEYADLYQKNLNIATYLTLTVMCICIFGGIGMLLGVAISAYRHRKLSEEQLPLKTATVHVTASGHEAVEIDNKFKVPPLTSSQGH